MDNIQLSGTYFLSDFTRSQTATRLGFTEQFDPPKEVVDYLKALVQNLIQPLRNVLGPGLVISSGYRCDRLNTAVGGKPNSQHPKGQAADLEFYENGVKNNQKLINTVIALKLEYDQMLDEFSGSWVHLSYHLGVNRKQNLTIS